GRLAEDHEHRLHADAAVGDVTGRHRHRHEQVAALAHLGHQRTVGDGVGTVRADTDVALVLHVPLGGDVALDVVAVDRVAAHAHRVGGRLLLAQLILGHDKVPD